VTVVPAVVVVLRLAVSVRVAVIEALAVLVPVRLAVSVRDAAEVNPAVVVAVAAPGLIAVAVTEALAVIAELTLTASLRIPTTLDEAVIGELTAAVFETDAITLLAAVVMPAISAETGGAGAVVIGRISSATILLKSEAPQVPPRVVAPGIAVRIAAFHAVMCTPLVVSLVSPPIRAVVAPLSVYAAAVVGSSLMP
jgi:hypothetical protein